MAALFLKEALKGNLKRYYALKVALAETLLRTPPQEPFKEQHTLEALHGARRKPLQHTRTEHYSLEDHPYSNLCGRP